MYGSQNHCLCITLYGQFITLVSRDFDVSKYDYITVYANSQLGWLNLPHLPILSPPVTGKQRMAIIQEISLTMVISTNL